MITADAVVRERVRPAPRDRLDRFLVAGSWAYLPLAIACVVGGAAFAASAYVSALVPSVVLLSIAMMGMASMCGPFWTLATTAVRGTGAAAGIALINSVGNIGGFVGPYILGYVRDTTGSLTGGLVGIGAILAAGGVLVLMAQDHQ